MCSLPERTVCGIYYSSVAGSMSSSYKRSFSPVGKNCLSKPANLGHSQHRKHLCFSSDQHLPSAIQNRDSIKHFYLNGVCPRRLLAEPKDSYEGCVKTYRVSKVAFSSLSEVNPVTAAVNFNLEVGCYGGWWWLDVAWRVTWESLLRKSH